MYLYECRSVSMFICIRGVKRLNVRIGQAAWGFRKMFIIVAVGYSTSDKGPLYVEDSSSVLLGIILIIEHSYRFLVIWFRGGTKLKKELLLLFLLIGALLMARLLRGSILASRATVSMPQIEWHFLKQAFSATLLLRRTCFSKAGDAGKDRVTFRDVYWFKASQINTKINTTISTRFWK